MMKYFNVFVNIKLFIQKKRTGVRALRTPVRAACGLLDLPPQTAKLLSELLVVFGEDRPLDFRPEDVGLGHNLRMGEHTGSPLSVEKIVGQTATGQIVAGAADVAAAEAPESRRHPRHPQVLVGRVGVDARRQTGVVVRQSQVVATGHLDQVFLDAVGGIILALLVAVEDLDLGDRGPTSSAVVEDHTHSRLVIDTFMEPELQEGGQVLVGTDVSDQDLAGMGVHGSSSRISVATETHRGGNSPGSALGRGVIS